MTRAILISIQPKWVEKIFNGEKTIEIRKTMPKCELPIDVYIYCTKNLPRLAQGWSCCEGKLSPINLANGKVIAKFTLNKLNSIHRDILFALKTNYTRARDIYNNVDYSHIGLKEMCKKSCLSIDELIDYSKCENLYCWHIDNLVKFDEYKELNEFTHKKPSICGVKGKNGLYQCSKCRYGDSYYCECNIKLTKAPQSWCYVEGIE